ncbi:MAG: hypothetical protein AAF770_03950 [Bacteroidota bacterium]
MTKKQVEKMIYAGLANLFQSQAKISLDKFVIECLMLLEKRRVSKRARRQARDWSW